MYQIEQKMKRSGANADAILRANPKRNCLDRIKVPKRIAMKTWCCKFKISLFYCLFCVFLIDMFMLAKDVIQMVERQVYWQNYPHIIEVQVAIKTVIAALIVIIQGCIVLRKKKFTFCKLLYALKLFQIGAVFYHIFMDQTTLEEQCNDWLKTPAHGFYRDSRDTNGHRPMTMIYWCNFNRVFEDHSKSNKNKNLIHYFTYNYTIQKVLNSLEIVYCLFCMGLYLLIIYWNQEDTSQ
jgi:hypothetical protein